MTQEKFDKLPLLDQILYDTTGMLVEKHPSIAEAMDKYHLTKIELLSVGGVSSSAIKPPLGLIPKKFHNERVKAERFNEVCGAIARYYDAGLKINIEWIEEYNELVEGVGKHYR